VSFAATRPSSRNSRKLSSKKWKRIPNSRNIFLTRNKTLLRAAKS
jgi:hypothetical protein